MAYVLHRIPAESGRIQEESEDDQYGNRRITMAEAMTRKELIDSMVAYARESDAAKLLIIELRDSLQ